MQDDFLIQEMAMDERDWAERKAFLEFADGDEAAIRDLDGLFSRHASEVVDRLYDHLMRFDETRDLLRDEGVLRRVKELQQAYFRRLTQGSYDESNLEDRLKVGVVHERVHLHPKFYLGTYNHYFRIPILKIRDTLLVSIQTELHDRLAVNLQEDILQVLAVSPVRGVILDVTSLHVVDSFLGRMIGDTAAMARMMGARTVLVGIQPAVAITLVDLGLRLEGVHTALNMEQGLAWLEKAGSDGEGG